MPVLTAILKQIYVHSIIIVNVHYNNAEYGATFECHFTCTEYELAIILSQIVEKYIRAPNADCMGKI